MNPCLSYIVQVKGFGKQFSVYAAKTPGHAKFGTFNALRDAGFYDVKWTDINAKRLPQFDSAANELANLHGPVCIGWREGGESWGVGGQKIIGIDRED